VVAGLIPIKTPLGQAELVTRERRVSQRHRTVLFLVDGKRSAVEVRDMALKAGVPESCFDELVAMGLITLPEPTASLLLTPAGPVDVLHVELPLQGPDSKGATGDSSLPPSRTLYPESVSADSTLAATPTTEAWLPSGGQDALDPAFAEARLILLRAVRAEAPLAGSLTLMRLRRARTRLDLVELLDEVEARITKPRRSLAANQTMRRVRMLLEGRVDFPVTPA
jgi:hypothetical protein